MRIVFDRQEGNNYFFHAGWLLEGRELLAVPMPCALADLIYPLSFEQGEMVGSYEIPVNMSLSACSLPPFYSEAEVIVDIATTLLERLGIIYANWYELLYQPDGEDLPEDLQDAKDLSEEDAEGNSWYIPIDDPDQWGEGDPYRCCGRLVPLFFKNMGTESWYVDEFKYCIPEDEPIFDEEVDHISEHAFFDLTLHYIHQLPSVTVYNVVDAPHSDVFDYQFFDGSAGTCYAKQGLACDPDLLVYMFPPPPPPTVNPAPLLLPALFVIAGVQAAPFARTWSFIANPPKLGQKNIYGVAGVALPLAGESKALVCKI